MKPRQHHAPAQMTCEHNQTQAMMKVTIAPLHTLTPERLESIARVHASKRPGAYEAMLAELKARCEERRAREG